MFQLTFNKAALFPGLASECNCSMILQKQTLTTDVMISINSCLKRFLSATTSQTWSNTHHTHPMMPCVEEIPAVRGQTPITRSIKITVTSCCYGQQTARWLMKTNCCGDGCCEISLSFASALTDTWKHLNSLVQKDQMSQLHIFPLQVFL